MKGVIWLQTPTVNLSRSQGPEGEFGPLHTKTHMVPDYRQANSEGDQ